MTLCEDCGDEVKRRFRCWDCDRLVCGFCLHHEHGPHTKVVDEKGRELSQKELIARRVRKWVG